MKWQKEGLTRSGAGGECVYASVCSFDVPSAGCGSPHWQPLRSKHKICAMPTLFPEGAVLLEL